jgi:hypothetical protein
MIVKIFLYSTGHSINLQDENVEGTEKTGHEVPDVMILVSITCQFLLPGDSMGPTYV